MTEMTEFRNELIRRLTSSLSAVLPGNKFIPVVITSERRGVIKLAEGEEGIEDHIPVVLFDIGNRVYNVFPIAAGCSPEKERVYSASLPLIEQDLTSQGYRQS